MTTTNTTNQAPELNHGEHGVPHLVGAIFKNLGRAPWYAMRSRGRSLLPSFLLIIAELMLIPAMSFFDLWGLIYNRRGIPVMSSDFVSMKLAKDRTAELRFSGVADSGVHRALKQDIKALIKSSMPLIKRHHFREVANQTHVLLERVAELEEKHESLFAMHRHILESVGLAALNAEEYASQSQGDTLRFSRTFLKFQVQGLMLCGIYDRLAQYSHRSAAGIIENDVPYIPFTEKFRSMQS